MMSKNTYKTAHAGIAFTQPWICISDEVILHLMIRLHRQLPDWHMPGEPLRDNRANPILLGTHDTLFWKNWNNNYNYIIFVTFVLESYIHV